METDTEDKILRNSNRLSLKQYTPRFEIDKNDPAKYKDVSVWHTSNFSAMADIVFVVKATKMSKAVAKEKIIYRVNLLKCNLA